MERTSEIVAFLMMALAFAVATAAILFLLPVPAELRAYGSEPEIIDIPHVWVFVVDRACDFDAAQLQADIQDVPAYAPYIHSLDVVCFPNAPMLELAPVVDVLKQVFPGDVFVFVFDGRTFDNKLDWQRFAIENYGKYEAGLFGKAFVKEGYAVTIGGPAITAHEATHLTLRAIHGPGSDNERPETWAPAP